MPAFRFIFSFCCLLLTLGASMLRAQEESAELKQTREAYEKEIEFATRPIRDRYLLRLETLKRSLGARGDARGALAIQDEIDRVKNAGLSTGEGLARFSGVWRVSFADGSHGIYTIKADGVASWSEDTPKGAVKLTGKVTIVGNDTLLEFDDHVWIIRLSLAGDRLALDIFVKAAYPTGAPTRATAVRVGDRKP